jgi:cytochrome c
METLKMRSSHRSSFDSLVGVSSGHGFSHAEETRSAFRALAPEVRNDINLSFRSAAKAARIVGSLTARLKSCPDGSLYARVLVILLAACVSVQAQTPNYRGIGRAATDQEIRSQDFSIEVDGKELPPGRGTAREGAPLFAQKCAACHGQNLEGTALGPRLEGGKGTLTTTRPVKTIGSYWSFATSIWDYINRAMPRNQEGTLTHDQVYALTAYLLYKNEIIREGDVLDRETLPKIQMPGRNVFLPQRLEDLNDPRKRGCRIGHCP